MTEQQDLFGEKRIKIKGDHYLNKIAQHIYELVSRDKTLLDGDSTGEINRKVHFAMMLDCGLRNIILDFTMKSNDKLEAFREWYISKQCPREEETARAMRGLIEADYIRLPAKVIKQSEQFKQRIAQSIKR